MANIIKQLASFAVLNVNGGDRITYTYDEIDVDTGDMIAGNNKGSFYVTNTDIKTNINNIRNYISENKLDK